MQLILRQGRIVDPSQKLDKVADLAIDDGELLDCAENPEKGQERNRRPRFFRVSRIYRYARPSAGAGARGFRDD
jgi:hypothetical protein